MFDSLKMGKKGEDIAVRYLESRGYKILGRNYRSRYGEIDIIAEKGACIVFVEVKTRRAGTPFIAAEAVDTIKQKKIIKTAMMYLSQTDAGLQPRFDVIAVSFDKKLGRCDYTVDHIENAFEGVDFFETF